MPPGSSRTIARPSRLARRSLPTRAAPALGPPAAARKAPARLEAVGGAAWVALTATAAALAAGATVLLWPSSTAGHDDDTCRRPDSCNQQKLKPIVNLDTGAIENA